MWQRDRRQMAAVDAIASAVHRRRRPPIVPRRLHRPAGRGFRSVLCPIDFSEHSRLALRYAEAIVRRSRGVLTVLFVDDPLLVAAAAAALNDRDFVKTSAIELQRFVDETVSAGTRASGRVTARVAVGRPAAQILRAADRFGVDLIVLGSHGLTGVDRALLGSTTRSILGRTTVPVLAVPRPDGQPNLRAWPGRRIAAAVDLDRRTPRDIAAAVRVARWFRSSLSLIHVIERIAPPPWFGGNLAATETTRIAHAKRRLATLAAAGHGRVPTRVEVAAGRASDDMGVLAAAAGARLLVTALRDRRRWLDPRRGSITYAMIARAAMPILACPPDW
jgi:nucleotide-binding universal stress UspA family protein